jgi:hypothetical protein
LAQVELVLAKITTKALYRLQVNVTHEVQSRAREDVTELEVTIDGKDTLQLSCREGQGGDTGGDAAHVNNLKQKLKEVFRKIPDNA